MGKIPWGHIRNWLDPPIADLQTLAYKITDSFERLSLERREPLGHIVYTEPLQEVFCQVQLPRHSEATAGQGIPATAKAGVSLRCHPYDIGFADIQNVSFTWSWRLPLRFQRKTWEAGQYDRDSISVGSPWEGCEYEASATPCCQRCQKYRMSAKESRRQWMEPAQEAGHVSYKVIGMRLPSPF
jgi:hypothetical protein